MIYDLHPLLARRIEISTRALSRYQEGVRQLYVEADPEASLPQRIEAGDWKTWKDVTDLDFLAHPQEVMHGAYRIGQPHHLLPYHRTALQHLWDYLKEWPYRYIHCATWGEPIHRRVVDDPDSPCIYWQLDPEQGRIAPAYLQQVNLLYQAATMATETLEFDTTLSSTQMRRLGEWLSSTAPEEERIAAQTLLLQEWENDCHYADIRNFYHAILANDLERFLDDFMHALIFTHPRCREVLGRCLYKLDPVHPYLKEGANAHPT